MTRFEEIKNMDIDAFAEWVDEHGNFDDSSWSKWFDENYCQKCEPIECYYADVKEKLDMELNDWCKTPIYCAWCELEHKCKFFQDMDDVPSCKEIAKMWLELEV